MNLQTDKRHYPSFADDDDLLSEIKLIIEKRPTYGYRRVTAILNKRFITLEKNRVNHKRIYRIMKENNLLLIKPNRK